MVTKRILITGANSYIGVSFDNYLKQWEDEYDVCTLETMNLVPTKEMFEGYDAVFHVAGIAHIKETAENRSLYYKVNRDLAIEIAKVAKNAGVKQFVILSSMSVYGLVEGHITKSTKPNPTNAYGDSKLQADEYLESIAEDDFKVAILRPPMVYGKGCKGNYQSLRSIALKFPLFPLVDNKRSMIFIDNLSAFVKEVIDNDLTGLFFPQNSEYVNTSALFKTIATYNGKKCILISGLQWLIGCMPLGVAKKAFGSLTYEKVDLVTEVGFNESIRKCES